VQAGCSETSERSSSDTARAIGEEMMFMISIIACQMNCKYSSNSDCVTIHCLKEAMTLTFGLVQECVSWYPRLTTNGLYILGRR
jgi:hypothetical protein